MIKNEKGITLASLTITVILILTLAAVGVSASIDSYRVMRVQNFMAQMQVIQEKVNLVRDNATASGNPTQYYNTTLGFKQSTSANNPFQSQFQTIINTLNGTPGITSWQSTDRTITNYYYFSPEDLDQKLGIKNMEDIYVIINFQTGNVIERDGVEDPDNTHRKIYRQYDYEGGIQLSDNGTSGISATAMQVKIGNTAEVTVQKKLGTKQIVKLSVGQDKNIAYVFYKLETEDTWKDAKQISDYMYTEDTKSATFTIDQSGMYQFKIVDNHQQEYITDTLEVALCNPPVLVDGMQPVYWDEENTIKTTDTTNANWYDYSSHSKKWANAQTEDGSLWVWIPRYAVDDVKNPTTFKFLSGMSNTSTDQKTVYKQEQIPSAFTAEEPLTGIWIAKFAVNGEEDAQSITSQPGNTLSNIVKFAATTNCQTKVVESVRQYAHLLNSVQKDAALTLSRLTGVSTILTNDSIYAGGGIESSYIENVTLSTTQNVYGIYDFMTMSNIQEITEDSTVENGIYRPVLNIK